MDFLKDFSYMQVLLEYIIPSFYAYSFHLNALKAFIIVYHCSLHLVNSSSYCPHLQSKIMLQVCCY